MLRYHPQEISNDILHLVAKGSEMWVTILPNSCYRCAKTTKRNRRFLIHLSRNSISLGSHCLFSIKFSLLQLLIYYINFSDLLINFIVLACYWHLILARHQIMALKILFSNCRGHVSTPAFRLLYFSTYLMLKTKAIFSSESSANFQLSPCCYIPEDNTFRTVTISDLGFLSIILFNVSIILIELAVKLLSYCGWKQQREVTWEKVPWIMSRGAEIKTWVLQSDYCCGPHADSPTALNPRLARRNT
jgi:hypothetical protein